MKTHLLLLLLTIVLTSQQCRKAPGSIRTDVPGLPPATQTGANTLGFLLNGQPWTPQGSNGTANLSIDFDPGFNFGIFGINAYRIISQTEKSSFGIGIRDSLNFLSVPFKRYLSKTSIYGAGYSDWNNCTLYSHYDSVWSKGEIQIDKLDRTQRIISGKFEFILYERGCDTIKITNGRFDMKF
jgi:hypothetical protein